MEAHLIATITPQRSHEEARTYCLGLAERLAGTAPERYTLAAAPEARRNRVYIGLSPQWLRQHGDRG